MPIRIPVSDREKVLYTITISPDFSDLRTDFSWLEKKGRKLAIITDSHVESLYLQEVEHLFRETGNQVFVYSFPAGEASKNMQVVQDVCEFLIQNHFDRKDMLIALGGGVVGDLTGFAAGIYLRGISFIQIPTTLLAQTDSSIGGKTGVDFRGYKNMIGAFHQPSMVYMNTMTLHTLDERQFCSGMGEIVKAALIKDAKFFTWLQENKQQIMAQDADILMEMIARSCNIKRKVVEQDPTEQGERAVLNFGHTLGHAIEKLSEFSLSHGECVALGMLAALRISCDRGSISEQEYEEIRQFMQELHFTMHVTGIQADQVIQATKMDKKMDAGQIRFILLEKIGHAVIDTTVTEEEMRHGLKEVLA